MPSKRKVCLNEWQYAELVKTRDTSPTPYVRERAAGILKVASGKSVNWVRKNGLLRVVSHEALSSWIERYEQEGLEGLRVRPGRGRKPVFFCKHVGVETAAPEVQGLVHRSPRLYNYNCSTWDLHMIRDEISWMNGERNAKPLSLSGVSKVLKRLGVCYKRGHAHVHSPDLLYNKKMAVIQHAHLLNLLDAQRFVLLYEDEFTYYLRPEVGKGWGSKGSQGAIKAHQAAGRFAKDRIAACIDVQTGAVIHRQRSTYPVKEMYRFFYRVEQQYPKAEKVFIVLDNWSVHFHEYVKKNLARGARKIVLLPLPTYAPWENPIEKVWLLLKKELLTHHPFKGKMKLLKEVIKEWFADYKESSPELLHTVGLHKKMEHYRSIFAHIQMQGNTETLLNMTDFFPD
jgi:transposase